MGGINESLSKGRAFKLEMEMGRVKVPARPGPGPVLWIAQISLRSVAVAPLKRRIVSTWCSAQVRMVG